MNKFKVGQYVVVTNKTFTHYNTVLRIIENDEYNKCCLLDKDRNLWYSYEDLELFSKEETKSNCEDNKSNLDGSKNSFYEIPKWIKDLDDLSEYLELDPYEFNILKTLWIHKGNRHQGTNEKRELNKRLHYSNKSLEKFERLNK